MFAVNILIVEYMYILYIYKKKTLYNTFICNTISFNWGIGWFYINTNITSMNAKWFLSIYY